MRMMMMMMMMTYVKVWLNIIGLTGADDDGGLRPTGALKMTDMKMQDMKLQGKNPVLTQITLRYYEVCSFWLLFS